MTENKSISNNEVKAKFGGFLPFLIAGIICVLIFILAICLLITDPSLQDEASSLPDIKKDQTTVFIYVGLAILSVIFAIGILYYAFSIRKQKLTIDDNGVIGRNLKHSVDLPLDEITSVMKNDGKLSKSLILNSSSSRIIFFFIKNLDEVYNAIQNRLKDSQNKKENNKEEDVSKINELEKLFELKEKGILSEEEYKKEKDKLLK